MNGAMQPCPDDHPLMKAWKAWQETEGYKNSLHWAKVIAPFVQVGTDSEKTRLYEIMPLSQRETHIVGALWAAFTEGFKAGGGKL